MTAYLSSANDYPLKPETASSAPITEEDAWIRRINHVNNVFSDESLRDHDTLYRVLNLPKNTSTPAVALSIESPTTPIADTAIYAQLFDAFRNKHSATADNERADAEEENEDFLALRAKQRKSDRRSAIAAGILSGLGIRPRRPRQPMERLEAALRRASQTDVIHDPY